MQQHKLFFDKFRKKNELDPLGVARKGATIFI